jgi:hypothetical protein
MVPKFSFPSQRKSNGFHKKIHKNRKKLMERMMSLAQMRIFRMTQSINCIRVQPCSHTSERIDLRRIDFFRRRGPGPPAHINPLRRSLDICSSALPLLHSGTAVVFPFLCVLSGKLPFCQSVDCDSVPMHGLCLLPNCEVPITMTPPGTAGGYRLIGRRWRCVQHYLFSCKAAPRGCPDPTDLWVDLWDLLLTEAPAREHVCLALHVDSFDADAVRACCMPWLLDPFSFLQGSPALGVMLCAPLLLPSFS